jgi:DNA-binding CsgD family transcriptional regulator
VLALIAQGLSNQEIAVALHLSINSLKSDIRVAYRKIGVRCRSQAVLWALQYGFVAEPRRSFPHA